MTRVPIALLCCLLVQAIPASAQPEFVDARCDRGVISDVFAGEIAAAIGANRLSPASSNRPAVCPSWDTTLDDGQANANRVVVADRSIAEQLAARNVGLTLVNPDVSLNAFYLVFGVKEVPNDRLLHPLESMQPGVLPIFAKPKLFWVPTPGALSKNIVSRVSKELYELTKNSFKTQERRSYQEILAEIASPSANPFQDGFAVLVPRSSQGELSAWNRSDLRRWTPNDGTISPRFVFSRTTDFDFALRHDDLYDVRPGIAPADASKIRAQYPAVLTGSLVKIDDIKPGLARAYLGVADRLYALGGYPLSPAQSEQRMMQAYLEQAKKLSQERKMADVEGYAACAASAHMYLAQAFLGSLSRAEFTCGPTKYPRRAADFDTGCESPDLPGQLANARSNGAELKTLLSKCGLPQPKSRVSRRTSPADHSKIGVGSGGVYEPYLPLAAAAARGVK